MLAALTARWSRRARRDDDRLLRSAGFGATRGTALSALEMIKGGDVEWRDGELRPTPRARRRRELRVPLADRLAAGRALPGAVRQVTVPRHVDVRSLRTRDRPARADRRAARPARRGGDDRQRPGDGDAAARRRGKADRAAAGGAVRAARARRLRFTIVCDARAGARTRRGVAARQRRLRPHRRDPRRGRDADGRPGYDRSGALAPAQAFDPRVVPDDARAVRRPRRDRAAAEWTRSEERGALPLPGVRVEALRLDGGSRSARSRPADRARPLRDVRACGHPRRRGSRRRRSSWRRCSSVARAGGSTSSRPNRRSFQGGIGGAQWAGLEPELRRLHLNPESLRLLLAKRELEIAALRTPYSAPLGEADVADAGQRLHAARQLRHQRPRGPDPALERPRAGVHSGSTGSSAPSSRSRPRSSPSRSRDWRRCSGRGGLIEASAEPTGERTG